MRRYESISIVDTEVTPENRDTLFSKIDEIINQQKGVLIDFEEWGNRKLAYEIKSKARGYYVRLDYCGEGGLVQELERFFRIDDRVLKYLTVQLEKDVDMDQIKEEKERLAAEKEKAGEQEAVPEQETSETESETSEAYESRETESAAEEETEETEETEPKPESPETKEE